MTIGQRIKSRRNELGLSVDEVAYKLGKNRATIYRYENDDIKDLPITVLEPLAKALETTPADLMGWENDKLEKNENTTNERQLHNIYPIELKRFPLLGEIACGVPKFANEERESYIMAGTNIDADFCLKADGDSMINARIQNGDIVFIKKQDIVENGEIAAIVVNDDNEATLKRFYYYKEKAMMILKAENPQYEDQIYMGEELNQVHILGKAVSFQSDVM